MPQSTFSGWCVQFQVHAAQWGGGSAKQVGWVQVSQEAAYANLSTWEEILLRAELVRGRRSYMGTY